MTESKLNDPIELSKISSRYFQIAGISHIGIEDAHNLTSVFKELLSTGERNFKLTLGLLAEHDINYSSIANRQGTIHEDCFGFSPFIWHLTQSIQGVLLKIKIPECRPSGENNDMITSCYARSSFAFVYANTYEEALMKAVNYSREYVDAMIAFKKVMFVSGNTLTAQVEESTLTKRIEKTLRSLSKRVLA